METSDRKKAGNKGKADEEDFGDDEASGKASPKAWQIRFIFSEIITTCSLCKNQIKSVIPHLNIMRIQIVEIMRGFGKNLFPGAGKYDILKLYG